MDDFDARLRGYGGRKGKKEILQANVISVKRRYGFASDNGNLICEVFLVRSHCFSYRPLSLFIYIITATRIEIERVQLELEENEFRDISDLFSPAGPPQVCSTIFWRLLGMESSTPPPSFLPFVDVDGCMSVVTNWPKPPVFKAEGFSVRKP